MTSTQEQLAAIGFGGKRREPACWRTVRLDTPTPRRADYKSNHGPSPETEPACSPTLLHWCKILRFDPRVSPYRITRVER